MFDFSFVETLYSPRCWPVAAVPALPWNHVWVRLRGCREFRGFWLREQNEERPWRSQPPAPSREVARDLNLPVPMLGGVPVCNSTYMFSLVFLCSISWWPALWLSRSLATEQWRTCRWSHQGHQHGSPFLFRSSQHKVLLLRTERSFGPLMLKVIRVPAGFSHSLLLTLLPGMC